jgi:hypothetical protein
MWTGMGSGRWRLLIGFLAVWFLTPAIAQVLEGVLMPGKVIAGHAKIEQECSMCHVKFDKAAQDRLCLDCHKEVARDIQTKQGYHGRKKQELCRNCHTEHKGRDMIIAGLDEKAFEHALTDFRLAGAHARVSCKSCHATGKKYREAPGACIGCHRKDDRHKGSLGEKCADCHTQVNWKENRFDHDKTRFALTFRHASVECKNCHQNNVFKDTPTNCVGCHRKDDNKQHRGRLGEKCESCHTPRDWKDTASFQHDRDTKYPLLGRHRMAKCESCHTAPPSREKTPTACVACHKKDDRQHQGRLGDKCETCHAPRDWKDTASFQHDRDTKYPLLGRHRMAKCESCHTAPPARERTPSTCIACHKKDDNHNATLGTLCSNCHTERNWREAKFDHELSVFKLRGKHRDVECKDCHRDPKSYKGTEPTCIGCHRKDDRHNTTLGEQCAECHTEKVWKATEERFGHDRTRFALRNAHARTTVKCDACHKDLGSFRNTPLDCLACHKKDDKHDGQEGRQCEKCHDDRAWKAPGFDHGLTRFPLLGKHAAVECARCHTSPKFKDAGIACAGCHAQDDKHKKTLGPDCGQCHNARTWSDWNFDHDTRTRFVLDGRHKAKACALCHTSPVENRAVAPSQCYSCHVKDDIHEGGFGRQCQLCHVTSSFSTLKRRTGLRDGGAVPRPIRLPASISIRTSLQIPRARS